MRTLILLALLFTGAFSVAPAAQSAVENERAISISPPDGRIQADENSGPIAVPEPTEKARQYQRSGDLLWVVNTVWAILIPALFLVTGFSARIRDWARSVGEEWFLVIVVYVVIYILLTYLIDFGLNYYKGFVRPQAYGLSNQSLGQWFGDSLKTLIVTLVLWTLFLWVPYWLLRKSPRRWWLYTGILVVPFLVFFLLIKPLWIDPLFYHFESVQNKELETRILALAERAGIRDGRVFQYNASTTTTIGIAYVTGMFSTQRIVLSDTLLEEFNEREIIAVVGHEIGHFVIHHVFTRILAFSCMILLVLYAIYRTAGWLINKYQSRFGFGRLDDIASYPLLLMLFAIYSFVVFPAFMGFTRYQEQEANRFALEITQDPRAVASMYVKIQQDALMVPRPSLLTTLWRSSHPTYAQVIEFCNEYRPWEKGEKLTYGHLFTEVER